MLSKEEFKEYVKLEFLAKTNNVQKCMLKIYFKLPAKDKERFCLMYSVFRLDYNLEDVKKIDLQQETNDHINGLYKYFRDVINKGYWTLEEFEDYLYDKNGNILDPLDEDYDPKDIVYKKEVTTKEYFFLDKTKLNEIKIIDKDGKILHKGI